ncbi:MAG TPA: hypothetical protein VN025_08315 [Candidatus Dormibacteraeota bacterium]|nr:hypothetical protein [Candidatus Dormibacteraeota bacterium]
MIELREPAIDEKKKLEALRAKRERLFNQFLKNPSDIKLAIEIKAIDDQVAASTARSTKKRLG